MRFGKKGKLSPKFIGPYEILERVGNLAYRLALLAELDRWHNVFHVSQLKKYVHDATHVLQPEVVSFDGTLSYEEKPVRILDTKTRETRRKTVKMVKVLWSNHETEEVTLELEDTMRERYPDLFAQELVVGFMLWLLDDLEVLDIHNAYMYDLGFKAGLELVIRVCMIAS
ncbi:PREDICTED: uncharacterized protein LOC109146936 [Ipomoea nil]|uniref:uncharacterized protein LOC109146936 n=1 Tax=Ipomoea nil TaxID=35883 RepID=UPI0009014683|nr:PREDICTED: uncharacterized protein LOC109146936 [Ipomoea nil]